MDFKHFNVHYKSGEQKGKITVMAESKETAKLQFNFHASHDVGAPGSRRDIPFEAEVVKVIGPLGMHVRTHKQILAQRYGFIIGSIKGAKIQCATTPMTEAMANDILRPKILKAANLVDMQFAKLQRDIRDLFKLAGLKVK